MHRCFRLALVAALAGAAAGMVLAGSAMAMTYGEWRVSWGGDIVQPGTSGDLGTGFEFCVSANEGPTATPSCQVAARTGRGGEFGAGGPAGAGIGGGTAIGALEKVYVADPGGNRIQVFPLQPHYFLAAWGKDVVGSGQPGDVGTGAEVCTLAERCKAGIAGGLGGEFSAPMAVGARVGGTDSGVYVADTGNHRIVKLTVAGGFVSAWGKDVVQSGRAGDAGTGYEVCTVAADCQPGAAGSGLGGELSMPTGITIDGAGHVFVVDAADLRVQRFTSSGVFERAWGKDVVQSGHAGDTGIGYETCTVAADCKAGVTGTLGGEFGGGSGGLGIAFGNAQVFVSDANDNRVQRFDTNGAFQRAWGKGVNGGGAFGVCTVAASCQAGATGGLGGELTAPSAIAADGAGVYVAESAGSRLQQFDFDGVWSDAWGRGVKSGTPGYGHCTSAAGCLAGTVGAQGGAFSQPLGVAAGDSRPGVGAPGNGVVVVADAGNGRLDEIVSYANGASGPDRGSTFATNGFTQSTAQHPYDIFYGTLTLTRPDGSTLRTKQAFASQIRVTQAGADALAQALENEPRIVQGFTATAPDGGPWITTTADPLWWERPNGAAAPLDQPSFDAQGVFTGQLSAEPQLAAGESASCTDTPGITRALNIDAANPWPKKTSVGVTFGPELVMTGPGRIVPTWFGGFDDLFDTLTSSPAFRVYQLDRTCTVQSTPPVAGSTPPPQPPVTPPPAAASASTFASVVTLPSTKALRSCSSRRAFALRLKAPTGDTITSATVTVNGRTATKLTGKTVRPTVNLRGLPKGKFTVKIVVKLRSGKTLNGSRSYKTCVKKQARRRA